MSQFHREPREREGQGKLFPEPGISSLGDRAAQNPPEQIPATQIVSRPSGGNGISRDEMNLAEFPLTVLSTRVDPNVKTLEFSDFQRGKDGELTERKWIITGADKFGLPTATDDDVILGLIRLTMDDGFRSRKVFFTRYELLRALQWSTEGRSYTRLVKSLDRLSGVRIRASNAFYDNSSKSYQTKNFGIVDAYELNDHRGLRNKPKKRLGQQYTGAGAPAEEDSGKSFFIWSEMLFDSFRSGFIKKLDLDLYFTLRSSVSRRLYRYLDKHFYFRPTVERPLMFLAFEKLGISRNYRYVSSVKQQLEPAATELVSMGYLSHYEFSGKGEQTVIRFFAARTGEKSGTGQYHQEDRAGGQPRRAWDGRSGTGSAQQPMHSATHGSHGGSPASSANHGSYQANTNFHSNSSSHPNSQSGGALHTGNSYHGGSAAGDFGSPAFPSQSSPHSSSHGPAASVPASGHGEQYSADLSAGAYSGGGFEDGAFRENYRGADLRPESRGRASEERGQDESLRSQLIEDLVSRGISIMQAKRLLEGRRLPDLQQIDRIVSYYDHLVETSDSKVSRNKVGFLYRAVESPYRFQLPPAFLEQGEEPLEASPRSGTQNRRQQSPAGGARGGSRSAGFQRNGFSGPLAGASGRNSTGRTASGGAQYSAASEEGLRQARLRQAYFEFVSGEVAGVLASMSAHEREELRRQVEEKMSCLGTVLSPERFEEAIRGCMREEVLKRHSVPDFKRWSQQNESLINPKLPE